MAKRDKGQKDALLSENCLPKVKLDTNGGTPKRKGGDTKRSRPRTPLIKPTEGEYFAEIRSEINYKVEPEDNGAEVPSIRKTEVDGVRVELGPKTTKKYVQSWNLRSWLS